MKLPSMDKIGPGILVTAAFIGPGTVTVCLLSGNTYGFALLWALVFAIIATTILQEMSARLGLVTGSGLSEAIQTSIQIPWIRFTSYTIIVTGILLGNAAYEAGNISGAMIGVRMITNPELPSFLLNLIIYIPAFLLLFFGNYKTVEKFFITIVLLMSVSFLAAAIISKPDISALLSGFAPTIPDGSILAVVGLIGTTVVPYNLFLHSSMIHQKWQSKDNLPAVKRDTYISVIIGGIISGAIIVTGASLTDFPIQNIQDLSGPFEQIYGVVGKYLFGFGIFAAGFTSTITAPLAASLVAKGLFGWKEETHRSQIKSVWIIILTIGYLFASLGYKPIEIIKIAQFANGLLLPLIAGFLIWVVNRQDVMGKYINTKIQNLLSIIVLLISIVLGMKGVGIL